MEKEGKTLNIISNIPKYTLPYVPVRLEETFSVIQPYKRLHKVVIAEYKAHIEDAFRRMVSAAAMLKDCFTAGHITIVFV